jgi:dolichol-phosphate mannosyltransferase
MRAVAVIPTYNERENLNELVLQIRQQCPGLHILVVDDNSPDGTGVLADELAAAHPGEVAVLHRERKQGLGRAYVAGFEYVLAQEYDVILQMDADLSHSPAYLPKLLDAIRDNDVVLGSRYLRGVNVVNWDLKRLILSKCATRYVQIVTGMNFTDLTGGFKCWRRAALESIQLDRVFANGYLFQIETTYQAHRRGLRIAEVPIIFYDRQVGLSKIDFSIIREALLGVVKLRVRAIFGRAPKTALPPAASRVPIP